MRPKAYVDWSQEPDLPKLRASYQLLQRDPQRALPKLHFLADRGSIVSMGYLGDAYKSGVFGQVNITEAERWYTRAADSGSVIDRYNLGHLYLASHRYDKAREAFTVGMADKFPPAGYMLGRMYWLGIGGQRNACTAKTALEEAVGLGSVQAKFLLAEILTKEHPTWPKIFRAVQLIVTGVVERIFLKNAKGDSRYRLR